MFRFWGVDLVFWVKVGLEEVGSKEVGVIVSRVEGFLVGLIWF